MYGEVPSQRTKVRVGRLSIRSEFWEKMQKVGIRLHYLGLHKA